MMMKYDVFSSSSTHHQTKMQRPDNPFLSSFSCCSTGRPSKPAKPRCDVLSPGRERMPNGLGGPPRTIAPKRARITKSDYVPSSRFKRSRRSQAGVHRGMCNSMLCEYAEFKIRASSCSVRSRMHARTFTRESMSTSDAWTCRWAAPHSKTSRRGSVRCPAIALILTRAAPAACRTPQQTGSEPRCHACSPVSCTLR
jgi:hypothetical protein